MLLACCTLLFHEFRSLVVKHEHVVTLFDAPRWGPCQVGQPTRSKSIWQPPSTCNTCAECGVGRLIHSSPISALTPLLVLAFPCWCAKNAFPTQPKRFEMVQRLAPAATTSEGPMFLPFVFSKHILRFSESFRCHSLQPWYFRCDAASRRDWCTDGHNNRLALARKLTCAF